MFKKKLTLSIDDELLERAKSINMNISEFLELCLCEKFRLEPTKSCWKNKSEDSI